MSAPLTLDILRDMLNAKTEEALFAVIETHAQNAFDGWSANDVCIMRAVGTLSVSLIAEGKTPRQFAFGTQTRDRSVEMEMT